MQQTKRRVFLKGIGLSALFISGGSLFFLFKDSKKRIEKFMEISEDLTGKKDLDKIIAQNYLDYFLQKDSKNADIIDDIYKNMKNRLQTKDLQRNKTQLKLEQEILLCWYTGLIQDGKNLRTITYANTLAWQAVTFAKPKGICALTWEKPGGG